MVRALGDLTQKPLLGFLIGSQVPVYVHEGRAEDDCSGILPRRRENRRESMQSLEKHSEVTARVCQSTEIAEGKHAVPQRCLVLLRKGLCSFLPYTNMKCIVTK